MLEGKVHVLVDGGLKLTDVLCLTGTAQKACSYLTSQFGVMGSQLQKKGGQPRCHMHAGKPEQVSQCDVRGHAVAVSCPHG